MNLAYDDRGSGEPVLFIAGRGGAGRTWHLHQVPAFQRAGYRVITFDNRGVGATENAQGFTTEQMVGDTAALIEKLDAGPVRIVAVSMGSFIAQELMFARRDLVSAAVLMATRGREDRTREFFRAAEFEFLKAGISVFPGFVLEDRAVQLFLVIKMPEDNGFVDFGLGREIPSRRATKAFLGKELHRCCENVLPAIVFHK